MPAELFTMPSRAADANGLPYSGALAYFYATGTTTLQSVYTTSALSVAHANPVVADAGGKFANIYMDPALSYRCVIKNSTGSVTLHDIDPINSGAGFFLQSQTGAVSRSVQDRLRDTVHAFDFIPTAKHAGILAGSNTDDLDGYLQAALDSGYLVELPRKVGSVMWIGSSLSVPSKGGMIGNFGCTIKALANFGDNPLIRNATADPATDSARDQGIILSGVRVDGNKANNATGTEHSHGIQLNAVDGVYLDVWTVDPKGDGVYFSPAYAIGGGSAHYGVGNRNVRGFIRSETAARQGVAVICMEAFDLSVFAYKADLIGFDIEPDHSPSFIRNGTVRLTAIECGQAGSGTRGGLAVYGTNFDGSAALDVRDLIFDLQILNGAAGFGVNWRDINEVTFRGTIKGQTGNGIEGSSGGFGASRVNLDIDVISPTNRGMAARSTGDIINGRLNVVSSADIGIYIENAAGGTLQARVKSAGQEGIQLSNTDNMTFPDADVTLSVQSGVSLTSTSSGNRFPGLRSTGSVNGWGYIEASGCSDNRVTDARLASNSLGTASVAPTDSLVEREKLFGKATYDAASIADGDHLTSTVTVTGAAVGDEAQVTFGVSLAGLTLSAYVSAANTVTFVLNNQTGGAVDLASTTVKAYVTSRSMA